MKMSVCRIRLHSICMVLGIVLHVVQSTTTKYYTYEEDAPGTEIGNLSQDLKIDPGEDPQTSFRFIQKTNFSLIQMRQIDGLLTVGEIIDREQLCPHSPRCMITFDIVAFTKEKFQLIHVEIEVRDINDNSPKFPFNETYLEISENLAVGTRFPLDIAVDKDVGSNYIQSYQMSFNSYFGLDMRNGEDGLRYAELVLVKKLDRESEDFYSIEVTALDGGNPPRTGSMTVFIKVLDFNDNSPIFEHSSLKVELNEDAPLGFLLLKVRAFDPDDGVNGEVVYSFVEETSAEAKRVFQIDPFSGAVTLKDQVDYETRRSYELNIQANDLGTNSVPSTCKVVVDIVDVNDNAPEISIKPMTSTSDGVAYITEAAAEESFVALISTSDRDSGPNGYVRCSLIGHDHFKLQKAYGDSFMIVTTTTLDRERIPEYNLTVVAEDLGSPPFKTVRQYTIRVTDENDNAPLFSKSVYEVSVLENNVPGSYVATVVARDLDMDGNGKVTYKLIDEEVFGRAPLSTYVSIDPVSGSLYTVRSFDYELVKQIEVNIQATDKGSPQLSSTALIRIKVVDQNDNTPYITYPLLHNNSAEIPIPYNAPSGYLVLRVKGRDADDGVNGQLTFRITKDDQMLFSINKESGEIVLKYGLTFLCGDMLEIMISVSDNGRSSRSADATVRFLVTEMQLTEDQVAVVLESSDEEHSDFDISLMVIIVLGGGCGLLLIAIVTVALSCKHSRRRNYSGKKDATRDFFKRSPLPMYNPKDSNAYVGPRSPLNDQTTPPHDDSSSLCGDRSGHSETKVFLPSLSVKHFDPVSLWQGDKYSLQLSGIRNADQLSVKDSGKGDSDFNDSDSDISGDGCKKNTGTLNQGANSSFHSLSTHAADRTGRYCVAPSHPTAAYGSAYTIAFSQAPAPIRPHANPASLMGSGYCTSVPKARGALQTFRGTGTLPPHFYRQECDPITRPDGQRHLSPDAAVSGLSEVATSF